MKNGIDHVIASIDGQIRELERSKAIIIAAQATAPQDIDEPKVRKPRRKRTVGLPQATPPASEANHLKTGERL